MRPMRALILAAGRGERMRPLTNDLPKPLLPAGGQPLIDYHIQALARAGIRELVVNLSWHGEKLRDYLGDGRRYGVTFSFSEEGPEPLETGGGIHHALPLLGPGVFWVVNGDIACDFRFSQRRASSSRPCCGRPRPVAWSPARSTWGAGPTWALPSGWKPSMRN